jgi:hypothetical protein
VSLDNGASFEQWKNGYPSVSTYDMVIQEREADLVIASFGRSLWVLDNIRPLRKLAASAGQMSRSLQVFDSPEGIQAEIANAPGYEWSTWGMWDAENRPTGVPVTWFYRPGTADTVKGKKSLDSAKVRIYNDKNELIRNLRWKTDTGFNKNSWGFEEKGYRMPGSPKPKPGAAEPGGQKVVPGRYKLVMEQGVHKDSTWITVKDDPRKGDRSAVRTAQDQMRGRLRKSSDRLTSSMDQLADAEEILSKVEAQYKDMPGAAADSVRKATKAMQDSIKGIREFISGKRQTAQGYGQVPQTTVMSQLQQANQAISAKPVVPGAQEEMLVGRAETAIDAGISRIDRFMKGPWQSYRSLVEATKPVLFK